MNRKTAGPATSPLLSLSGGSRESDPLEAAGPAVPRFYIAETHGFLGHGERDEAKVVSGVTVMVLDRGNLHRVVAQFRSEDMPLVKHTSRPRLARARAQRTVAALNAGDDHPRLPTRGQEHGTVARYRHGRCRCELCTTANREYCRAWRQKKRQEKRGAQ